jgi:hypothetical protein
LNFHAHSIYLVLIIAIDKEVKVIRFRGDPSKMHGFIEVRGIVNRDGSISYGEYTQYDKDFGKLNTMMTNYV